MDKTDQYLTIRDAAERLRVSDRTVRRRIADGSLTGYRLGRLIRLSRAEVDASLRVIPSARRFGAA